MHKWRWYPYLLILPLGLAVFQNCSSDFAASSAFKQSLSSSSSGPSNQGDSATPADAGGTSAINSNSGSNDPLWDAPKQAGLVVRSAVLRLSPFEAYNSDSTPLDVDFSSKLIGVNVGNLLDVNHLSDGHVEFDTDSGFPQQIASPHESLSFSATDPKFRQVNSYYHIDRLVQTLIGQKIWPSNHKIVSVDANCSVDPSDPEGTSYLNNAYFDPENSFLCLGYAPVNGFRARSGSDVDVSVHEFGHSVNHAASTSEILGSTIDMGALDEGLADTWAFLQNGNPKIAKYYGSAIYQGAYNTKYDPFPGLRDLSKAVQFPDLRNGEIHHDSPAISAVFYGLQKKGTGIELLRKLVLLVLEDLQMGSTFAEALRALRTEGVSIGIPQDRIDGVLQTNGLLRKDDMNQITTNSTRPIYVIDNHEYSFQANGNCNGQLDEGEKVLLYVNLQNAGATLGTVTARLSVNANSNLSVLSGGDVGSFYRFKQNANYLATEIKPADTDTYKELILWAGYAIEALPGSKGSRTLTLTVSGFNTVDNSPQIKTISIPITVGQAANVSANCPGNGESSVWP